MWLKTTGCAAFHKSGQKLLLKYGPDKPKEYVSETVFNMNSTQEQLYDVVGSDLTKKTLEGYNGNYYCSHVVVIVVVVVIFFVFVFFFWHLKKEREKTKKNWIRISIFTSEKYI